MRRIWVLVALVAVLSGCSGPAEIGQSQIDQSFPKRTDKEVQAELKTHPEAYANYLESQRRNAEAEAANSGR